MAPRSYLCAGVLLLAGAITGAPEPGKTTRLTSASNTIAGPALLEGAPGSKTLIFSNFSGDKQQYGITIVNHGNVEATLKDCGQFGGSNFSAAVPPGPAYGAHIILDNGSSVEVSFDKSEKKSAQCRLTWRVDIVPKRK
jgi:hypothetical protein